jgi:deazaflavin-dependent oxidoreductase (nitroreductase family)
MTAPEQVFDNPTRWVNAFIRRYDSSDGRFNGHDALLLTTRGRRTGRLRRTALYYGRDGDRLVLVATERPGWYRNLLDNPVVVVQVRTETFAALARPATPDERPRLWRLMLGVFPKYARYAERAGHELPIVVLSPHREGEVHDVQDGEEQHRAEDERGP